MGRKKTAGSRMGAAVFCFDDVDSRLRGALSFYWQDCTSTKMRQSDICS